jgi:hypothetical protein
MSLATDTLLELSADLKLHMDIGLGDLDSHLTFKVTKFYESCSKIAKDQNLMALVHKH